MMIYVTYAEVVRIDAELWKMMLFATTPMLDEKADASAARMMHPAMHYSRHLRAVAATLLIRRSLHSP